MDTRPTFRRGGWEGPGYEASSELDIAAVPDAGEYDYKICVCVCVCE